MEVDGSCKMILHIGGIYQDKEAAILRFAQNYKALSEAVKRSKPKKRMTKRGHR